MTLEKIILSQKIHNQELLLSPTQSSSFSVYWPFEMPLFQFQPKLPLHLNLSHIPPPLFFFLKKIKMHFVDQAFLCSLREISIILQQDFHWLRLLINSEIPTEVELFTSLSVCFSILFFSSFRNAINDCSEIIKSADKRIIYEGVLDDRGLD